MGTPNSSQSHSQAVARDHARQHNGDHIGDVTNNIYGQSLELSDLILDSLRYKGMEPCRNPLLDSYVGTWTWMIHENVDMDIDSAPTCEPASMSKLDVPQAEQYGYVAQVAQNFRTWLRMSDELFYIEGEAMSGKSTLMKLLATDGHTKGLLRDWSGGDHCLVIARFFASNNGTRTNNLMCLLRCLLYQIYVQEPGLVRSTIPIERKHMSQGLLQNESWTMEELRTTLKVVLTSQNMRFVFFVDALDELYDDSVDINSELWRLNKYQSCKVCVSSRPVEQFAALKPKHNDNQWILQDRRARDRAIATRSFKPTVLRFSSVPPLAPNIIDLEEAGAVAVYSVDSFKRFLKENEVLDRLRTSYAALFDNQAEAVMPMPPAGNEMKDRLRSVAENIRSADLAEMLKQAPVWYKWLEQAMGRLEAEHWRLKKRDVVGMFERPDDRACAEAILAKSWSRVELAKREMRISIKFVDELKKWDEHVRKSQESKETN